MKICRPAHRECGLTLIELFVVILIIGFLGILIYSGTATPRSKARALRIQCVNNMRQVGLSFRIWSGDCGDSYTTAVSTNRGGSKEFTSGPYAFRHFLSMSNELSTPKVLFCPSETALDRFPASMFSMSPKPGEIPFMSNSNLSYFVGINAREADPSGILSGDRNLTNGIPPNDGIMELTAAHPAGWTTEMHHGVGNITLADGSVLQASANGLRAAITNAVNFTNRLQLPVLSP